MTDKLAPVDKTESFFIDTSQPPYEVPCPVCLAFALDACRNKRKEPQYDENGDLRYPGVNWPRDSRVIPEPHQDRWEHWNRNPQMRVKAIR